MSKFIATVLTINTTINIEFNELQEYSDNFDALKNPLKVQFFMNESEDTTDLTDNEFDFFKNFDDISYQLIEDFESGDYDDIINDVNNAKVAFEYLVENENIDAEDALEIYMNVGVFEGTVEDYADEFISDVYNIPSDFMTYVDVNKFATDLENNGDIFDLGGYVITNATEF